jgi:hypothetical protein
MGKNHQKFFTLVNVEVSMNLKLYLASLWLPKYIMIRELDRLATATIAGLDNLLENSTKDKFDLNQLKKNDIEGRRGEMASIHNQKVKKLIDVYGYSKGIEIGRRAMYQVGLNLGLDARRRLGVGNTLKDLEFAAKILYKVLGIEFRLETRGEKLFLIVNRCTLADYYTSDTCRVLSAADEGVFHGLSSGANMKFEKRITENEPECMACIKMEGDV